MKSKLIFAARMILGLLFFTYGINGFSHIFSLPPMEGRAVEFIRGLAASGYFFPLLNFIEAVAGAGLLFNRFVPLALTALAPIVVHIVAVHLFLAPAGLPLAMLIVALECALAWEYGPAFVPLLRSRGATRDNALA